MNREDNFEEEMLFSNLHIHTKGSVNEYKKCNSAKDTLQSVQEQLRKLARVSGKASRAVISITDHNSLLGFLELEKLRQNREMEYLFENITIVPGIELTVSMKGVLDSIDDIHISALNFNVNKILEHFPNGLVPAPISFEKTLEIFQGAGATLCLNHPGIIKNTSRNFLNEKEYRLLIEALTSPADKKYCGISAIEVLCSANLGEKYDIIKSLADEYGLYSIIGNDYHGATAHHDVLSFAPDLVNNRVIFPFNSTFAQVIEDGHSPIERGSINIQPLSFLEYKNEALSLIQNTPEETAMENVEKSIAAAIPIYEKEELSRKSGESLQKLAMRLSNISKRISNITDIEKIKEIQNGLQADFQEIIDIKERMQVLDGSFYNNPAIHFSSLAKSVKPIVVHKLNPLPEQDRQNALNAVTLYPESKPERQNFGGDSLEHE